VRGSNREAGDVYTIATRAMSADACVFPVIDDVATSSNIIMFRETLGGI
jgi:hypothetical protein